MLLHLSHCHLRFSLLFLYVEDKHFPPLSIDNFFIFSMLLFNLPEQDGHQFPSIFIALNDVLQQ